jgi:hypothetical protein
MMHTLNQTRDSRLLVFKWLFPLTGRSLRVAIRFQVVAVHEVFPYIVVEGSIKFCFLLFFEIFVLEFKPVTPYQKSFSFTELKDKKVSLQTSF